MVMAVFTLPSFDVVFKLIKDRFPQSKRTTPEDVQRRYKLVFDHDKVGRLVDAQEFRELSFRRDRFDEELIEELLEDCTRTVTVTDDEVILHHVYTERRVHPLNLYVREVDEARAKRKTLVAQCEALIERTEQQIRAIDAGRKATAPAPAPWPCGQRRSP